MNRSEPAPLYRPFPARTLPTSDRGAGAPGFTTPLLIQDVCVGARPTADVRQKPWLGIALGLSAGLMFGLGLRRRAT